MPSLRSPILRELCKPDRVTTASGVFDNVRHDIEPILVEEQPIVGFIQTPVVKRLGPGMFRLLPHAQGRW